MTLRIPFYRPSIDSDEMTEVMDTLRSGWLTTGPKTKQFEREFAAYLGHKHAVAVNSCTAALHLALEAAGIGAGEGVLVPTMTFAATAEVVRYLGAIPVLVDCHEHDFNLDVADAERRLEEASRRGIHVTAIVPVHYGGQIGDVTGVTALARRYHLKVIEDAAHCCPAYFRTGGEEVRSAKGEGRIAELEGQGARGEGRSASGQCYGVSSSPAPALGALGDSWQAVGRSAAVSCFSFYANKCITTGEGGMACTDDDAYADRMRIMSLHGISRDAWKRYMATGSWYYEIIAPGYKYNLTDIASAIGLHQLRKADQFHRRRTAWAAAYFERLKDVEELILPQSNPDRVHSWHLFVVRLRLDQLTIDRAEVIAQLTEAGIGTSVHYLPLHMHPYYRETFGYRPGDLPRMARVYPEIVTLPLYPDLTEDDVDYVCQTLRRIVAEHYRSPLLRTAAAEEWAGRVVAG